MRTQVLQVKPLYKYSSVFRGNRCPPPLKQVYDPVQFIWACKFVSIPSNSPSDNMETNTFWLKFGGLRLAVTLKIRSRSSKPIQLFIMSKCYIHANVVKIRQLRYCAHEHLMSQIWQFKSRSDLEKLVKITKTKSALHHVAILYPCKSG